MIDTLNIRYTVTAKSEVDSLVECLKTSHPEGFQEIKNIDGNIRYRGKVQNMLLFIDDDFIFINGSLSKLYQGDNTRNMSLSDVSLAIDYLNTLLDNTIDVRQANVKRLDFGMNIRVKNNPSAYVLKLYNSSSRMISYYKGQTFSSGNESRGMVIYDKSAESNIDNDNILRLEVRIRAKHVFKLIFGNGLPSVSSILLKLNKLPFIWLDEYNRLEKEYSTQIDNIKKQKDLLKYTITQTGLAKCVYVLENSYVMGNISRQTKSRYYKIIRTAFTKSEESSNQDLMKELDDQVYRSYETLLEELDSFDV